MNRKRAIEGISNYSTGFTFGAGIIWTIDNPSYQGTIITIAAVIMLVSTFMDASSDSKHQKE
jgi:hypothetical protein